MAVMETSNPMDLGESRFAQHDSHSHYSTGTLAKKGQAFKGHFTGARINSCYIPPVASNQLAKNS